jgi:hypothetical protein
MVGIDDGEPGPEQCRADAAALGVGMYAEGLQVPDRLLRERPLQRRAGSRKLRKRTGASDGSAQQRRCHASLAQHAQRRQGAVGGHPRSRSLKLAGYDGAIAAEQRLDDRVQLPPRGSWLWVETLSSAGIPSPSRR